MLFPITPPSTPILGHLLAEQGPIADGESRILITNEVEVVYEAEAEHEIKVKYEAKVTHKAEQKYERTLPDISQLFYTHPSNNPWKLFYVTTNEIEAEGSGWVKVASTPGIYFFRERLDGYHEVLVDELYVPWLLDHNFQFLDKAEFEFLLGYDPTQPTKKEVDTERSISDIHFLEDAFKAIWSRRSKGLKSCLRSIVPLHLETALEWALLSNDILESSPPVREKFTLCLVLLALSLLEDYNTPSAVQLLEKNQDEVLQAFRKDPADLSKAISTECQNREAETHLIGLVRRLFIFAGGLEDVYQLKFDQKYTAIDNLNQICAIVNITGSFCCGNSDFQAMISALSKSKAITDDCIDTLDITELMSELITLLPIGFQTNLGLSIKVPEQLPLCSKLRVSPSIYPLHVPEEQDIFGDGVCELQKCNDRWGRGETVTWWCRDRASLETQRECQCVPSSPVRRRLAVHFDVRYQGTQQRSAEEITISEGKPNKRDITCGLGHIILYIYHKFLGRPSNREYIAL